MWQPMYVIQEIPHLCNIRTMLSQSIIFVRHGSSVHQSVVTNNKPTLFHQFLRYIPKPSIMTLCRINKYKIKMIQSFKCWFCTIDVPSPLPRLPRKHALFPLNPGLLRFLLLFQTYGGHFLWLIRDCLHIL